MAFARRSSLTAGPYQSGTEVAQQFYTASETAQLTSAFDAGKTSIEMPRNIPFRIAAVVLATLTVAAVILASINYSHESQFSTPTDQVFWAEAPGGLIAQKVIASRSRRPCWH